MKIAIRGGHNRGVQGANGIVNEVAEDRRITAAAIKYLTQLGHEVLDVSPDVTSTSAEDLSYGISKANSFGAAVGCSIHLNASGGAGYGTETINYPGSTKGKEYGTRVTTKMAALGFRNRGAKDDTRGLYELKNSKMPWIIIECFFCDNQGDVDIYNRVGVDAIGKAIAEGLTGQTVPAPTPAPTPTVRDLGKGDSGEDVAALQRDLIELNYLASGTDDGDFGPMTQGTVIKFQGDNNLTADGIVGSITRAKIAEKLAEKRAVPAQTVMYRIILDGVQKMAVSNLDNAISAVKNSVDGGAAKSGKVQRNTDGVDVFTYEAAPPAKDYEGELCRIIVNGDNVIALTGKTKCINWANANYTGHIKIQCVSDGVIIAEFDIAKPAPAPEPIPEPTPIPEPIPEPQPIPTPEPQPAPVPEPINIVKHAIVGRAECSAEQMSQLLLKKNPSPKINCTAYQLASMFLAEGAFEGIRGDIAFAQACHETGWFAFGGDVVPEQNNYCGLGTTGGGVKGAYFAEPYLGVRAQIQHLKAYASIEPLKAACVDPRYSLVTKGVAPNLEDLAGKWAVPGYSKALFSSLEDALRAGKTYGQVIWPIVELMKAEVVDVAPPIIEDKPKEDTPVEPVEPKDPEVVKPDTDDTVEADETKALQLITMVIDLIKWIVDLFKRRK